MSRDDEMDAVLKASLVAHKTRSSRAALRCGLGDATIICDLIAKQVEDNHRRKPGGVIKKEGVLLAAIVKRCGDAIWDYRKKVTFDDVTTPTTVGAREEKNES